MKKYIIELILNFIITLTIGILVFLINKYFALYLGLYDLGLMKLFTQLLSYLNLTEIGVSSASAYALYKPLAEKNYAQINIIMTTIGKIYNKIFIIILLLGLFANFVLGFFINEKISNNTVYLYWNLYVFNVAISYLFAKYTVLLMADQKFKIVRGIQGGSKIFCQILQIIVIVKFSSFLIFILILILDSIIQYNFLKIYYFKYYKYIVKVKESENSIINNVKKLFWHRLAGVVVFNTDIILISRFVSVEMVGIYASYQIITQTIITILHIFLNVIQPKIGKFIAKSSKEKIFYAWKKLNILFLYISIISCFCFYKLVEKFILLWLGNEFLLYKNIIVLMSINLFSHCFRRVTEIFKENYGYFQDINVSLLEAIINFIFSIILVNYFNLMGILLGTVISNIVVVYILRPILVFKKCFDRNIKDYIKIYGNYLFLIIISLLSCNFILKFILLKTINSWFDWIGQGIIIGSITLVITFIIFLSNKDFRSNLEFLRRNKK